MPYVEDLVSTLSSEVKIEVTLLQVLSQRRQTPVGGEAAVEIPYSDDQMEENEKKAVHHLNRTGEALRNRGVRVTVACELCML